MAGRIETDPARRRERRWRPREVVAVVAVGSGAGDGADVAAAVDFADYVVGGVGDVDEAVHGVYCDIERAVERRAGRGAAVSAVPPRAGARDDVDDTGVAIDASDDVVLGVGEVQIGQDPAGVDRLAAVRVDLGIERRAAIVEAAANHRLDRPERGHLADAIERGHCLAGCL